MKALIKSTIAHLRIYFDRFKADRSLFAVSCPTFRVDGTFQSDSLGCLFCTGTGVYILREAKCTQLLSGNFFGCTRHDGYYYFFQKLQYSGRILKCSIHEDAINEWSVFKDNLSRNIHQIDVINEHVVVTDPSNNRLLVLDTGGVTVREVYPLGKLSNGKSSSNYAHFNSVFCQGNSVYVVAHNYTQYSGRASELLVLDKDSFKLREVFSNIGRCAHNVIARDGYTLVCDSLEGILTNQGKEVARMNTFTRGLAMNDDYVIVGGSMYGKRAERIGKDCFAYFLTRDFTKVLEITFENIGPMFEVRFLGKDYGLSQDSLG